MGLLDSFEQMAAQKMQQGGESGVSPATTGSVAGGLMQALDEHPGGLAGVLQNFEQNGMGQHVQKWASGQQQTATPEQVQQGLQGTGLIDNIAAKAGISPKMTKVALATVLPMVIAHYTNGGQQAAPSSGFGGIASQILGRVL